MIRRWLAGVGLAGALLSGCSVRPEDTLIGDFFAASRLRDLTALARIGTVVFEPRDQGVVTTFTIRSITEPQGSGGGAVKDVAIDAPVRMPDGTTINKVLMVRLQRRPAGRDVDAAALYGGWIVTAVTEAPQPGAPAPR